MCDEGQLAHRPLTLGDMISAYPCVQLGVGPKIATFQPLVPIEPRAFPDSIHPSMGVFRF